jgi:hypothetical protein
LTEDIIDRLKTSSRYEVIIFYVYIFIIVSWRSYFLIRRI